MIKVKLGTLWQASQARGTEKKGKKEVPGLSVLQVLADSPMPVAVSYRIGKIFEKVQAELKIFEDKRISLIKKHAVKGEDGEVNLKKVEWNDEGREAFGKDFQELLDIEVELDAERVKLSLLVNVSLPPKDAGLVEWLIENDL